MKSCLRLLCSALQVGPATQPIGALASTFECAVWVPVLRPSDTARVYPGEVVDLSRNSDAVLGLPAVGAFQAPTQLQREHWPAFTFQNL